MLQFIVSLYRVVFQFNDYKPQSVNIISFFRWLWQYKILDWCIILKLLNNVIYISEKKSKKLLVSTNQSLLYYLIHDNNIPIENIIYATFSTPGSSSQIMLGMLRDALNLERRKVKLIDIKDTKELYDTTLELGSGAIIYVDDFVGTGHQFSKNRNFAIDYITGNFSEFFLSIALCEEGKSELEKIGVEPINALLHTFNERPLHNLCKLFPEEQKNRLISISKNIDKNGGLGYKSMASMVILYRNAPNNAPLILRGNLKQIPKRGIFPRTTDLPVIELVSQKKELKESISIDKLANTKKKSQSYHSKGRVAKSKKPVVIRLKKQPQNIKASKGKDIRIRRNK